MTGDPGPVGPPSPGGASLPVLLDVTRLARRIGDRRLSGVDRVEAAYLRYLTDLPDPAWGLIRTRFGYLLLGAEGLGALRAALADPHHRWDPPDILARLARYPSPARARAETTLRRLAVARCSRPGLARMLRRAFPTGVRYVNTGETNLDARSVAAIRALPRSWIDAVLHDVIPLDWPGYVTPASAERFRKRFDLLRGAVDRIVVATDTVRAEALDHFPDARPDLQWCVAPFGLDLAPPDREAPLRLGLRGPYVLVLGTLEPRKNIELVLDIWHEAAARGDDTMPTLVLCGARGWYRPEFFARLAASPLYGTGIVEVSGAPDAEVAGLIVGAEALLFPTRAEGFGFPALEALARRTPVICSDLPVFRETLGRLPVYLPPDESYAWLSIIKQGCAKPDPGQCAQITDQFTWDRHFSRVFGRP